MTLLNECLVVSFQGIGGFLPGVKQIANVAALPGIVGVRKLHDSIFCLFMKNLLVLTA